MQLNADIENRSEVSSIRESFNQQASTQNEQNQNVQLSVVGGAFDRWTEVSETDEQFEDVVANVMHQIHNPTPTVADVALTINEMYPINPLATAAVRKIRAETDEPIPLGTYFQPTEESPYSAVCVHKTLLAQAVATQYGLDTGIVDFMFLGQIKDGQNDGKAGMHSALEYFDQEGAKRVADAHKGIDSKYEDYWKNFSPDTQIYMEGYKVFGTPNTKL